MQAVAAYTTPAPNSNRPRRADNRDLFRRTCAYIERTRCGCTPGDTAALAALVDDLRARAAALPRRAPTMTARQIAFEALRPQILERGVLWGRDALRRFGVESWRNLSVTQLRALQTELSAS